jgi:F0F1-type ATP synthase membrane subunit b/b'
MQFRTLLIMLLAAGALAFAAPVHATPPAANHGEQAHGDAAPAQAHGEAAHAKGDHGDGDHAEHHYYSDDDDGDNTANWADPDSELFVVKKLLFHLVNLVIFLGLGVYFVKQPLGDALRTRALAVRRGLADSATTREAAQERYDEVAARIAKLSEEIEAMKVQAVKDAKVQAAAQVERAHADAKRIGQSAERNIRDEVARARAELRQDAVALAVELAESHLRDTINAEDQKRLAHEFLTSIHDDGASTNA